jgi:hypothetical protein
MSGPKARQQGTGTGNARVLMQADERAIVVEILDKVLGDDAWFDRIVPAERSKTQRVVDRLALARILRRMERQFPGCPPQVRRGSLRLVVR